MRNKPELLAPAGDMERLKMSVLYGADAVYLAGTSFGMRSFAGNFSPEELPEAVRFAHDHGVKVHVTVNTLPRIWSGSTPAASTRSSSRISASSAPRRNTPPTASATSPRRSALPTMPARTRGTTSAQSASSSRGSFRSTRSAPSGKTHRRRWRSRPLPTAQCACPTPAAAFCPII